jgi:endoglucanase
MGTVRKFLAFIALLGHQASPAAVRGNPSIVGGGSLPTPSQAVGASEVSPPSVSLGSYNYDRVLELSLLFYEAQRSGRLPRDNRVSWRGDSCIKDIGQRGEDLEGGYYDGEYHEKFLIL